MGKIRVLPDDVASQVAAGEVVERPASLVKELVENSLDAGSTRVWIEYYHGGARFVSVRDDGCGMDREDALLCLERHATSKIRAGNDLESVRTMGFRGEALPSIASVSRFRLVTREATADAGTEITVAGGRVESVREVGSAPGTQIEVRELFYNLPARRKFLRGEETESAHILHGLEAMALASPGVAFECRKDGREVLSLPRADSLAVRIRDVFGPEYLNRLTEMTPLEGEGFRLSGFLAKPGEGRRDRLQQHVILNGRPIQCPEVQQPLREAYSDALLRGEHPICVLSIEMDTALVDCNVHPAKREVRLRHPEALRRGIFDAARATLQGTRTLISPAPAPAAPSPVPAPSEIPLSPPFPVPPRRPVEEPAFLPPRTQTALPLEELAPPPLPPSEEPATAVSPIHAEVEEKKFKLMGVVRGDYLVLEGAEGLVLLDARAAAERILFESLMRQMDEDEVPSQHLLIPAVVELPAREQAWVTDHLEELQSAGFQVEAFGGTSLKIEALPAFAADKDPARLFHEIATAMQAAGKLQRGRGVREALARSVSRLAADERFSHDEEKLHHLMRELLKCDLPYASPTGRPTMIQFSFAELDRKFGRRS
ncbi:DNA mismatch repair endonuclease MutL [soil metagenome]